MSRDGGLSARPLALSATDAVAEPMTDRLRPPSWRPQGRHPRLPLSRPGTIVDAGLRRHDEEAPVGLSIVPSVGMTRDGIGAFVATSKALSAAPTRDAPEPAEASAAPENS